MGDLVTLHDTNPPTRRSPNKDTVKGHYWGTRLPSLTIPEKNSDGFLKTRGIHPLDTFGSPSLPLPSPPSPPSPPLAPTTPRLRDSVPAELGAGGLSLRLRLHHRQPHGVQQLLRPSPTSPPPPWLLTDPPARSCLTCWGGLVENPTWLQPTS